MTTASLRSTFW